MEKAIKRYWPVFVLPTLAAFCVGFIYPFVQGLYLSFCKFTTIKKASFNGITNYVYALTDADFWHSFWFTALFTVVSTVLINVLAFTIALALTSKIKGSNVFRTVFFMPNLIGGIVLGYIWQILLNCVLTLLEKPLLSLNATYGFWGLIILMCWQQIGYMMIIYIAGLQSIPTDYLEAAHIDGANSWQTFWEITVPLLMPTIVMTGIMSINGTLQLFDESVNLTKGGPANSTITMSHYIYNSSFGEGTHNFGYAAAMSFFVFILVAVLAAINLKVGDTRD